MQEISSGKWSQKGIYLNPTNLMIYLCSSKGQKREKKKANMQNPCSSFEFQQQFLEQHREQLSLADQ